MYRDIVLSWPEFKAWVQSKSESIQWFSRSGFYELYAFDGNLCVICSIVKNNSSDQVDFETNFKNIGNKKIDPRDDDGSPIQRPKVTKSGWHYEPRSLDWFTSKRASLYNRKHNGNGIDDGTDYADASLKFYDAAGVELVQGGDESDAVFQIRLTTNCVRTVVDWQPTYDCEMIGGIGMVVDPPVGSSRAYAWVIVAPDIPEAYGGSVPLFAGGWNIKFMSTNKDLVLNGRGPKIFIYDPVYNTNKMRTIIKHEVGAEIGMQILFEHYRA